MQFCIPVHRECRPSPDPCKHRKIEVLLFKCLDFKKPGVGCECTSFDKVFDKVLDKAFKKKDCDCW